MPKTYFSVDIESSGQHPWRASMLSLGACVIDGILNRTFYVELKPITREYELENFRIGASHLYCLEGYDFTKFDPEEVLDILEKRGESPKTAIPRFAKWIQKNTKKNHRPYLVAAPIRFEGEFVSYYMDFFNNRHDPTGHSGENINSVLRGKSNDFDANIKELGLREKTGLKHNALEDAIQQAKELYTTAVHMRQHKIFH